MTCPCRGSNDLCGCQNVTTREMLDLDPLPDTIYCWHGQLPLTHIGTWATTRYPIDAVHYTKTCALPVAFKQSEPPQVKPLVWQRNGNHWAGGHGYVVRKFGSEHTLTVRNQFDRNFPTVEAAKAAAQADHTRRILDALL